MSAQATIPSKISISIDRETKVFHDIAKFTQYLSRNPALQRKIKGHKGKTPIQGGKLCLRKRKKVILCSLPQLEVGWCRPCHN
jgi:hypothetical protein